MDSLGSMEREEVPSSSSSMYSSSLVTMPSMRQIPSFIEGTVTGLVPFVFFAL